MPISRPPSPCTAWGAQTMAGREFTRKLTFWDGELHSLSLELLAEEGEDLERVFQSLEEELRARWSVAMENELNVTQAPALDNGETYQRSRFVRVESDTGETAMLLNALDQETETGYRTVCLGVDISLPIKSEKKRPAPVVGERASLRLHDLCPGEVGEIVDPQQGGLPQEHRPAQVGLVPPGTWPPAGTGERRS